MSRVYSIKAFVFSVAVIFVALVVATVRAMEQVLNSAQFFLAGCARTWTAFIGYVSHIDRLLLIAAAALLIIGLIRGLAFVILQLINVRRLRRQLDDMRMNNSVGKYHARDGIFVVSDTPFAITLGFLRPVIYVSTGLVDRLTVHELRSVMAHEQVHARNMDPLRLFSINFIRTCLFFLPISSSFVRYIMLCQEARADRVATRKTSRLILASALLKIIKHDDKAVKFPVSVAAFSLIAERAHLIVEDKQILRMRFSASTIALSILIGLIISFTFSLPESRYVHAEEIAVQSALLNREDSACQQRNVPPYHLLLVESQEVVSMSFNSW